MTKLILCHIQSAWPLKHLTEPTLVLYYLPRFCGSDSACTILKSGGRVVHLSRLNRTAELSQPPPSEIRGKPLSSPPNELLYTDKDNAAMLLGISGL